PQPHICPPPPHIHPSSLAHRHPRPLCLPLPQPPNSTSPAALSYGGLVWTHSPRPSGRRGGGVGMLLPPLSTFQVLPNPPSLSFSSFEAHCI
ncbi:unnamed protein product, partial [Staurois parvus]